MKRYAAIVFIALFCATIARAQVPGYLGRRFLITAHGTPAIIFPFDNLSGNASLKFGVTPRYGLGFEYVTSRRRTFGVRYSFNQTKGNVYNYIDALPIFTGKGTLMQHRVSLRTGRNSAGSLPAPLGMHAGWDLSGTIAVLQQPGRANYIRVIPSVFSYLGYRRALGNRFMAGVQFELNWFYFGYIFTNMILDETFNANPGNPDYNYRRAFVNNHYYNSNLLNFSVELSILP